jgi:hypothetical protein
MAALPGFLATFHPDPTWHLFRIQIELLVLQSVVTVHAHNVVMHSKQLARRAVPILGIDGLMLLFTITSHSAH